MEIIKQAVFFNLCLFLTGCFYFTSSVRKMEKALKKKECSQARLDFLSIEGRENKKQLLAKKAVQVCLPISKKQAVWFYQYLSERERNKEHRLELKKTMARIYFEEIKDYEAAVKVYSFLQTQDVSAEEKQKYSFRVAQAYFEMGKWLASLNQVERVLSTMDKNKDNKWVKVFFLKGRILLMQERYKEAEDTFIVLQRSAPGFFKVNKVFLYLSFIYESRKEFHQAISNLKEYQNTSEFLMSKIKRLKIRQNNQPARTLQ
ncbi:MAG: hypothetical protein OXM55_05570 [Bdellovibrionales bacterium]|nr:hypothetical protein [Bdellovibrionales bacterium]